MKQLYIDTLFWIRRFDNTPATKKEAGMFLTADEVRLGNYPPYLTVPAVITTVTTDGDVQEFNQDNTGEMLNAFGKYIHSIYDGRIEYIGWYLDQIIIPCLCCNALVYNARIDPTMFRNLGEKWSKTVGSSVDRAFWQGWYSAPHQELTPDDEITLEDAVGLLGLEPLREIENKLGDDLNRDTRKLMARISSISAIYSRYADTFNWSLA